MRHFALAALLALTCTGVAQPADTFEPDDEGYVRQWLVLAPIPLDVGLDGASGLKDGGLKDEARLKPKLGEEATAAGKKLKWTKHESKESHVDFNEYLGGETEDCVAYAVCYLRLDNDAKGLTLKVGSDDQSKVYLNGKEIHKFEGARPLNKDDDSVDGIELKKGVNVLVFKVVNEKVDFGGSLRFVDKNGRPFRGYKIALNP